MRFGVGGGSRFARGGLSVGKGGIRGGVGSGPFSISGGFGGRSGGLSGALLGMMILAGIIALTITLFILLIVGFCIVAVILQIQLASLAARHADLSSATPRQTWIWRHREGILSTCLFNGVCAALWIAVSQTDLSDLYGSLLSRTVVMVVLFICLAISCVSSVVTLSSIRSRRQDWNRNKGLDFEVYSSVGRWYRSIPTAIRERQWNRLRYAPWSEEVKGDLAENRSDPEVNPVACPNCCELIPEGITPCPICGFKQFVDIGTEVSFLLNFVKGPMPKLLEVIPANVKFSLAVYGRIKGSGISWKGLEGMFLLVTPSEVIVYGAHGREWWRKPLIGIRVKKQALDAIKLRAADGDEIKFVTGVMRGQTIAHMAAAVEFANRQLQNKAGELKIAISEDQPDSD